MFSGLPFYCCVEQFLALKNLVEVSKLVQHELLNYKSHCIFFTKPYKGRHNFWSHIYLFLRIQVFQDPTFSESRFFRVRVQVFEADLKNIKFFASLVHGPKSDKSASVFLYLCFHVLKVLQKFSLAFSSH